MRIQSESKVLAFSIILLLVISAAITIIPNVLANAYTQMPDRDTHTEVAGRILFQQTIENGQPFQVIGCRTDTIF